jgi:hypothetical protein
VAVVRLSLSIGMPCRKLMRGKERFKAAEVPAFGHEVGPAHCHDVACLFSQSYHPAMRLMDSTSPYTNRS